MTLRLDTVSFAIILMDFCWRASPVGQQHVRPASLRWVDVVGNEYPGLKATFSGSIAASMAISQLDLGKRGLDSSAQAPTLSTGQWWNAGTQIQLDV
jgi:hypothetical protein